MKRNKKSGFTLLELLIVIAIIAILSVALVIVLNPAETLKKSRDAQRISDLSTLKTAIGLYLTSTASPQLDGTTGTANAACKATVTTGSGGTLATVAWTTSGKIWYSLPTSSKPIANITLDGGTGGTLPTVTQSATVAAATQTDGTGWIPVNFSGLTGGSPISNLPLDPTNTAATTTVASTDLVYRYACSQVPLAFEIDAQLESTAYTSTDDKRASDGGNAPHYYEVGTNLNILGVIATGTPSDNLNY